MHKVRISKIENRNRVFIDDKEIKTATAIRVTLKGGEPPKVIIVMDADVEVETDAEVKEYKHNRN